MREYEMSEPRWKEIIEYLEGGKYPSENRKLPIQDFEMKQGVLYYVNSPKDRAVFQLVIPDALRSSALKLAHASKVAGHPCVFKTHLKAKSLFYFPGLLSEVINYVKSCPHCQRRKGTLKVQAPLQEFPEIRESLDRVVADLINLHHSHSAFHPEANGMTERTNHSVKDMLAILAEHDASSWDEHLPYVQLALSLLNRHNIVYGEDYPSEVLGKMRNVWNIAAEASKKARNRYAHLYDKQVRPLEFKEGSLVLRVYEAAPDNHSRKLAPRWQGPYRVIKRRKPVNFVIKGVFEDQVERTLHVNKLKRYHAREELELPSARLVPDSAVLIHGFIDESGDEDDPLSSLISSQNVKDDFDWGVDGTRL
ncbi:uncharacterized protein [Procambarus clarkii]|uniref:uncharacterized protein n=1 Tax=Procambarus clarkii TaxID=6728 RepID=UPI003743E0CA